MRAFNKSALAMTSSSPESERMRVVLRPIRCTVPDSVSMPMASPISNGLSTRMDSDENRSPKIFCSDSATATPPMPKPVKSADTLMPRLVKRMSSTITHKTILVMRLMALADSFTVHPALHQRALDEVAGQIVPPQPDLQRERHHHVPIEPMVEARPQRHHPRAGLERQGERKKAVRRPAEVLR